MNSVEIQLLGAFAVTIREDGREKHLEDLASKSRKGVSLLEYLILHHGKPVPAQRLIRELWSARHHTNPSGSLKTMISRLRAMLNEASDGLGDLIRSDKGAYYWESRPDVAVDAVRFTALAKALRAAQDEEKKLDICRKIADVYRGDLYQTGDMVNGEQLASFLHREYLESMYAYVNILKSREAFNEIVSVCEQALKLDELDEFLRIELMRAMVMLNRSADANAEYRKISQISRRFLDEEPSEDLQQSYRKLSEYGHVLQYNLDAIRNELMERENGRRGPLFCDYEAFKEFYNIQMRNLERLGATMFLAVIAVAPPDREKQELSTVTRESAMAALQEILRRHLRKGDIVTRFAPTVYAMLLPTVNYSTGSMVMERVAQLFYGEYPGDRVELYYRISPLGGLPQMT